MIKKRLMASIFDFAFTILLSISYMLITQVPIYSQSLFLIIISYIPFIVALYCLYLAFSLGIFGFTLGEWLARISIVNDSSEEALNIVQAFGRPYLNLIFLPLYPISLYYLYITNWKQNLVDKIMKTKII